MDLRPVVAGMGPEYGFESSARSARLGYRHPLPLLAYVRIDHANGGIIRNLSDSGLGIQAVGRLHPGQVVHLRFELLKPKIRVEATAQVSWAEGSGQAGLRFTEIPSRTRRLLKDWVFTDLLAAAKEIGPGSMFGCASPAQKARVEDGLMMSPAPFVPIHLDTESNVNPPEAADSDLMIESPAEMPLRLSWWPMDISPTLLAMFIDSLVVCASVLLFSVITIAMTGIFPSWTVALLLGMGVTLVFALLYWYLFIAIVGATAGRRLARMAAEDMHWLMKPQDDTPRFR
jgi:PilZ domain